MLERGARPLGAAVLFLLIALAMPACADDSQSVGQLEIVLSAQSIADEPVRDSELDRSVAVLQNRFDQAGIDATVTRGNGAQLVVRLDQSRSDEAERAVELSTRTGLLEFYDLEANLVTPSIDDNHVPVAQASLYDLLVGRQSPAREDDVDTWYLFDSDRKLADGPAPSKGLLLPGGALLDGWRILGVPPKTAVLECGIGELVCPGVAIVQPTQDFYYLIRHDPPAVPELTGADLKLEGTRQDFDTATGEPIVIVAFSDEGVDRFSEITSREANRGKLLHNLFGGGGPHDTFQHFAIVLDREIKSWPSIDWEQYPNGINGSNGVQITGIGDVQEAEDVAAVLQTGALPVRFTVVRRPAASG